MGNRSIARLSLSDCQPMYLHFLNSQFFYFYQILCLTQNLLFCIRCSYSAVAASESCQSASYSKTIVCHGYHSSQQTLKRHMNMIMNVAIGEDQYCLQVSAQNVRKLLQGISRMGNYPEIFHLLDDDIFIARCTLVQSAVLRSHVVRPSVRL